MHREGGSGPGVPPIPRSTPRLPHPPTTNVPASLPASLLLPPSLSGGLARLCGWSSCGRGSRGSTTPQTGPSTPLPSLSWCGARLWARGTVFSPSECLVWARAAAEKGAATWRASCASACCSSARPSRCLMPRTRVCPPFPHPPPHRSCSTCRPAAPPCCPRCAPCLGPPLAASGPCRRGASQTGTC